MITFSRNRSRREARVQAGSAVVMDLPSSAMEDPSPFVPPSQYEVSHCCACSYFLFNRIFYLIVLVHKVGRTDETYNLLIDTIQIPIYELQIDHLHI